MNGLYLQPRRIFHSILHQRIHQLVTIFLLALHHLQPPLPITIIILHQIVIHQQLILVQHITIFIHPFLNIAQLKSVLRHIQIVFQCHLSKAMFTVVLLSSFHFLQINQIKYGNHLFDCYLSMDEKITCEKSCAEY